MGMVYGYEVMIVISGVWTVVHELMVFAIPTLPIFIRHILYTSVQ